MKRCSTCHSLLAPFCGKMVCTNSDCNYSVRMSQVNEKTDLDQLVCDTFPSIVAHEYSRLIELISEEQMYGALLQMKDVWEVLLKLPILYTASRIRLNNSSSQVENTFLMELLKKPLGLGDWQRIGQLASALPNISADVKDILGDVLKKYNKFSIVNWRNDCIGHGALALNNDNSLREDIYTKINIIREHFAHCANAYKKLRIIASDNKTELELVGSGLARNIPDKFIEIYLNNEGTRIRLFPYILLQDKGIYFFDTFFRKKEVATTINYPQGVKSKYRGFDFLGLYKSLVEKDKFEGLDNVDGHSGIEEGTYSQVQYQILDQLLATSEFIEPPFLTEWLTETMQSAKQGIFLLQMERGMGKTTFCRSLDELSLAKIQLEDVSVRAYYINDSFLHKPGNFISGTKNVLRQNAERNLAISGEEVEIFTVGVNSNNKKEEFAQLLNFYQKQHLKYFGKRKLLFIIDGLDEIPSTEEESILDMIPELEQLNEGVYILLTTRISFEISDYVKKELTRISTTAVKTVRKSDVEYLDVLNKYVYLKLGNLSDNTEHICALVKDADHRFLYLKTLLQLHIIHGEDFAEMKSAGSLFDIFLATIKRLYSEKFSRGLIDVLCIIAISYEPLSIKEISILLGEEGISFRLLAFLSDLSGLLKFERSYRGNIVSIAHQDITQLIRKNYKAEINCLISTWVQDIVSTNCEGTWDDGDYYLLAYLKNYIDDYVPHLLCEFESNNKFFDKLFDFANNQKLFKKKHYECLRIVRMYLICLDFCIIDINKRAIINYRLAQLQRRVGAYPAALEHAGAAEQLWKEMYLGRKDDATGNGGMAEHWAETLYLRGKIFFELGKKVDALKDFDLAYRLCIKVRTSSTLPIEMLSKLKLGNCYKELYRYEKALECYSLVIKLIIDNDCIVLHADEYCIAVINRTLMAQITCAGQVTHQFDDDIRVIEDIGANIDRVHSTLARLYLCRGELSLSLGRCQEALHYFTKSIYSLEHSTELGYVINNNTYIEIYTKTAKALLLLNKIEEGLVAISEAFARIDKMSTEDAYIAQYLLMEALYIRATLLKDQKHYTAAIDDFSRVITLYSTTTVENIDTSLLIKSLIGRGKVYMLLKEYSCSMIDCEQIIFIIKNLLLHNKLYDKLDLVDILIVRGDCYLVQGEKNKALEDYTFAIAAANELVDGDNNAITKLLCESLRRRASLYQNVLRDADKAKKDQDCIQVLEREMKYEHNHI